MSAPAGHRIAYSSATSRAGPASLVRAIEEARALGFFAVHAATPPTDAPSARPALATHHVALTAVSTVAIDHLSILASAVDRAAEAAAALRHRLVVVKTGGLELARRETVEGAVETLVRAIHTALRRHPGLSLALETADGPARVVGAIESEWIVSELRSEPVGFWFDAAGALLVERSVGGPKALAWADRFGSHVMGLSIHGLAGGRGHGRPEDDGADWGTLRGLVPAKAPWVLDLASSVPAEEIVESRRFLEHVLREGP